MSRAVGLAAGLALLVPAAASAATTTVSVVRDGNFNFINAQGDYQNDPGRQIAISLQRGGAVIADNTGTDAAYRDVVVQPGDVLTASVDGQQVFNRAYDGLPTLDASVCGNATSFSGLRSSDASTVDQVGADQPNQQSIHSGTLWSRGRQPSPVPAAAPSPAPSTRPSVPTGPSRRRRRRSSGT